MQDDAFDAVNKSLPLTIIKSIILLFMLKNHLNKSRAGTAARVGASSASAASGGGGGGGSSKGSSTVSASWKVSVPKANGGNVIFGR
jgi:uncharacterized membrane protein